MPRPLAAAAALDDGPEAPSPALTALWTDGYSDRPHAPVPAPGYGHSHARQGAGYRSYACEGGFRGGHANSRYDMPSDPGCRDDRGYNDDRLPARRGRRDRDPRYGQDRGCGSPEVPFQDR